MSRNTDSRFPRRLGCARATWNKPARRGVGFSETDVEVGLALTSAMGVMATEAVLPNGDGAVAVVTTAEVRAAFVAVQGGEATREFTTSTEISFHPGDRSPETPDSPRSCVAHWGVACQMAQSQMNIVVLHRPVNAHATLDCVL